MVHQYGYSVGVLPSRRLSDLAGGHGEGDYLEYVICNGTPVVVFHILKVRLE